MSENAQKIDWSESVKAKITQEHIDRARYLLTYNEASPTRQAVTVASPDMIRLCAISFGSDNPIHCDEDYAASSRWGAVIAPGPMLQNMGSPMRGDPRPDDIIKAKKGLFKNIHAIHSGTQWDWYRHVLPGDRIYRIEGQDSVDVRKSEFAGQTVVMVSRSIAINQHGQIVGIMRQSQHRTERETAGKRGKYKDVQPASYTDADIAEIDEIYAQEHVQGSKPRYWEDVEIGDSLGRMAKGPLTVSDVIAFHMTGVAQVPWGFAPGRLGYQRRMKMPAAYVKDMQGIPDLVMRMHWDNDWAKGMGSPMAYDYAMQRDFWIYHYLTDWCGDNAIVTRMFSQMRKFNYIGDTQIVTGEVVGKRMEGTNALVDIECRLTSQRGDVTTLATATVCLPSRAHGDAQFSDPPAELVAIAQKLYARHLELSA